MVRFHAILAILAITVLLCHGSVRALSPFFRAASSSLLSGGSYLTQNASWMSQRIDHFTPQDRRVFQQRYFEYLEYFDAPSGPVFLKICGESTCGGIPNDYSAVLAKKFKAALVSLEHRYYGESSPFTHLTTKKLKYLTTNQALFDLASFRDYYQGLLRTRFNFPELENPWIVFGVSYSGALSAWFQLKFPHLSRGSLASSGVVEAIFNYTAFDKQVAKSAGPACSKALMEITALAEKGLSQNATALKSVFGAEQLAIDGDFMYFLADAAAIAFQYGNPDVLCGPLLAGNLLEQDLLNVLIQHEAEILKETEHLRFCESLEATCQSLKVRILFGSLPPSSVNECNSVRAIAGGQDSCAGCGFPFNAAALDCFSLPCLHVYHMICFAHVCKNLGCCAAFDCIQPIPERVRTMLLEKTRPAKEEQSTRTEKVIEVSVKGPIQLFEEETAPASTKVTSTAHDNPITPMLHRASEAESMVGGPR